MKIEEEIYTLLNGPIEEAGYKLDEVKYEKEDNIMNLKIIIDHDGVVTIDDVVKVTNIINPIIDEKDPIEENYVLDVSSKEKGSN